MRQTIEYFGTLYFTAFGTLAVGLLILFIAGLGVLGEILAIAALAAQSTAPIAAQLPGMNIENTVRFSVEFLTVVVAVTSSLVLAKFLRRLLHELGNLWRQRRAANRAAWGDWLARVPYAVWRQRRADARTFPLAWQPDAPDDGGFSDPVITVHGSVFVYVSPLAGSTMQEASPPIASGGQVTVTDTSGRQIGTGTLTNNPDPGQAVAKLEKATAGPKPTASELTAVYDFTITLPWLINYGITVCQQETIHLTAAEMQAPLLWFAFAPEPSG